ncbi:MAG: glycoside hydrolase family 13 protein, partial [Bacteroidota bacterium]
EVVGKEDDSGNPLNNFNQLTQLRRYGGDLQGVLDQLPYLDSLGITAIYFNPLNDAPSLHKYDPRHWRHIDRNFGPSPERDARLIAEEDPIDPATWRMTGADSLFVEVVAACHARGIRVILDYSWNHMGHKNWALQDVREKGAASPYADWFEVHTYDDPATPEDEFDYQGWIGIASLPEIKETQHPPEGAVQAYESNFASESVKQHIFAISKRWLDPNGDGDPEDGIDGFRLDVAGEVGLGFWRDYREVVRRVNPEAYLVGEIWWEEYPDKLLDPAPFVNGEVFDAVMNYRWYRAVRHYFAEAPNAIPVSEMVDSLERFRSNLRPEVSAAMMNLISSHDVPRASTSLFNRNKYKFQTGPSEGNPYKIHRPDAEAYETLRLILAQQFTYIGAPHIWAGDEMGMWGADDPNCRKPLIWPDYDFEAETHHPLDVERPRDEVQFDQALFACYQQLIAIRKAHPALRSGSLSYELIDDDRDLLMYRRTEAEEDIWVVFNASKQVQEVEMPAGTYQHLYDEEEAIIERALAIPPRSFRILKVK